AISIHIRGHGLGATARIDRYRGLDRRPTDEVGVLADRLRHVDTHINRIGRHGRKLSPRARPALPRAREARPTGCPAMRPRGRALGRKTEPGPRDGPASPATYSPQCGVRGSPSNGERAAAAAAARGVRVLEREAGTHHGGDVVDLHAI